MLLTACVARPPQTQQILDQYSGNTYFVVRQPLVFARERSDVAAHARDYATLVAVAVDESGKFDEYLVVHRWTTVDRRMLPAPDPDAGALRIVAEGRVIDLAPLKDVPLALTSRPELHGPRHGAALTRAYKVDLAVLSFIAASRAPVVRLPQEPLNIPFELWRDGRASLAQFVAAQGARER